MNRCIFVGRLTRDPEVSFSENKTRYFIQSKVA